MLHIYQHLRLKSILHTSFTLGKSSATRSGSRAVNRKWLSCKTPVWKADGKERWGPWMIVGDFTSWEEADGNKTQASSPADCRRWQSQGDKEASRKEEVWIGAPTPGTSAMSWWEISRVEQISKLILHSASHLSEPAWWQEGHCSDISPDTSHLGLTPSFQMSDCSPCALPSWYGTDVLPWWLDRGQGKFQIWKKAALHLFCTCHKPNFSAANQSLKHQWNQMNCL